MTNEYSITSYGRKYNPEDWFYCPVYVVNRIYYIVSGTAYYRQNTLLKPGFLYIFRATPYFQVSQSESDPVDHVYFDFLINKKLFDSDFIEIDLKDHPMLLNLLNMIKDDFSTLPLHDDIARAYLEILLHHLEPYLIPDNTYSEITQQVLQMIHNGQIAEMSVNQIAQEMNMNVNHIIRCFKKETGITPYKYIALLKTNLAIAYIRQGMSSTEIAENLGFSSLSAFSYFFKRQTKINRDQI